MIEKLDKALMELTEMAIEEIEIAKERDYFSKDFAEAVCIIFTMAYNRWGNGNK